MSLSTDTTSYNMVSTSHHPFQNCFRSGSPVLQTAVLQQRGDGNTVALEYRRSSSRLLIADTIGSVPYRTNPSLSAEVQPAVRSRSSSVSSTLYSRPVHSPREELSCIPCPDPFHAHMALVESTLGFRPTNP